MSDCRSQICAGGRHDDHEDHDEHEEHLDLVIFVNIVRFVGIAPDSVDPPMDWWPDLKPASLITAEAQ
jgi:hypothetical protein